MNNITGKVYNENFGEAVETPDILPALGEARNVWAVVEEDDANGGGIPVFVTEATSYAKITFAKARKLNREGPASAVYKVIEAKVEEFAAA